MDWHGEEMGRSGRVVIVDPAWASSAGHHGDVNQQLMEALAARGWPVECWCDGALANSTDQTPRVRFVFRGCGYEDPRHWADLGGTLHLARRMEEQLVAELKKPSMEATLPVAAWVLHTALPFHLLGLARALRHAPAGGLVVVSLMFPPGECLEPGGEEAAAEANCRLALNGLARAVEQGGHSLVLELPSRQSEEIYQPLLAAAGLLCTGIHPAVVGAGSDVPSCSAGSGPRILLHWGDLKPGKGRAKALGMVNWLLSDGPVPAELQGVEWLFQTHGHEPLPEAELDTLAEAQRRLPGFLWLNERVATPRMQELLAGCDAALLAYDPVLYRQRSSGVLWCYGAARWRAGRGAVVAGLGGGWLEREARELGIGWIGTDGKDLMACLMEALNAGGASDGLERFTADRKSVV